MATGTVSKGIAQANAKGEAVARNPLLPKMANIK